MSKLSLKKKATTAKVASQVKITGFFSKPPNDIVSDETISVLENVTNKVENDTEPLVSSPIIKRKEKEVFDKTPEINNKRKFKMKSRRLGSSSGQQVSCGGRSKTKLEDKVGFKRKLEEEEVELLTSPVFKKQKDVPDMQKVLSEQPKDNLTRLFLETDNEKTNDTPVSSVDGDDWEEVDDSDFLSCLPTEVQLKTPTKQVDEDLFLACLDDSPFPATSPPPPQVTPVKVKTTPLSSLPLSAKLGRHKVTGLETLPKCLKLYLHQEEVGVTRTAVIMGSWLNTVVNEGDIVNIEGDWDTEGITVINDKQGLLVVSPDTLVSGTAVVSALFCMRKAVLAEKFKGSEGGNRVMLIGTLVHELLQEVLRQRKYKRPEILELLDTLMIAPRMVADMSSIGMSDGDMRKEVEPFIGHIQYFVKRFLLGQAVAKPESGEEDKGKKGGQREQWKGKVVEVRDIEENFWSPRLGIKGKIDLTVETVGARGQRMVQPLEIKTGKPSYSSSHMGQVMLYCMMSGDRREQSKSGLLLYLRSSGMCEVPAGIHEQRGLVQLRNELVAWIKNVGPELPDPISHEGACKSCGLLSVCSMYQSNQDTIPLAPHPMAGLVKSSLSHLQAADLAWFKKWTDLLDMEVGQSKGGQELKDLWCLLPEERERRGQAVVGLALDRVDEGFGHWFVRNKEIDTRQGLVAGEVAIVSTESELALSQGIVKQVDRFKILVFLDRDLTKHGPVFTVDRFTYQGGQASCYVGLARMMADTAQGARLRGVLVEKCQPGFSKGLGREVATHGKDVMRKLNRVQQKAVFKSMMCEQFSLIRGMPGSGKTTTIVGLVRLLAKLGQSVLLVAYTNSAVDTILLKLQEEGQEFLRLGRKERVRPELVSSTAEEVARRCTTPTMLSDCYSGYMVVGSTCLGVDHAATVNRQFDWCVLDEASQALLPSVLSSLLLAKRFILVGDPAQLPPTVQSSLAKQGGLDQSMFTMLDMQHPSSTTNLHLQYRMNSRIADLANHLTYEGKLECGDNTTRDKVIKLNPGAVGWLGECFSCDMERSVVWVDTMRLDFEDKEAGGICNKLEAKVVKCLVSGLVERGVRAEGVGVIAPYSAQVKFIKADLKSNFPMVEVGTVDQYQGRDKEVIIYTCTRCNMGDTGQKGDPKAGHILLDTRRLNVAITRAKVKLIIIGDRKTLLRDYKPFQKMDTFFKPEEIVNLSQKDLLDI